MTWKKYLKKALFVVGKPLLKLAVEMIFKAADKNKDGAITKTEARTFITTLANKRFQKKN